MKEDYRQVAYDILNNFDAEEMNLSELLERNLGRTEESGRCRDSVCGIVRNTIAIDMLISQIGSTPIENINSMLINILRIGVYELLYSESDAEYAAVNEAVKLAAKSAGTRGSGFVNAILRNVVRSVTDFDSLDFASNVLPIDTQQCCQFDRPLFADFDKKPINYLRAVFSLPDWLVEGWNEEYGLDKTVEICLASNRKPSLYVKANTLKVSNQELLELFEKDGVEFEFLGGYEIFRIAQGQMIRKLPGFKEGYFWVQDITASQVASKIISRNDMSVLDLCSAPGSKTVEMARVSGGKADILATDINRSRLVRVRENCERLGISNVKIVNYNSIIAESKFDAVLLDVPCSNTGVLAKRHEVRYNISHESVSSLVEMQREIMDYAKGFVEAGGKIIYSTCSLEAAENRLQIEGFLKDNPDFKLEFEKQTLPSANIVDFDGGYLAILTRK